MQLPRSSYKILRLILLGYLHQGGSGRKASTLKALERATGVNTTQISANNKALADMGLIEIQGGSYHLTEDGYEVARALEFEESQLIGRALRPTLLSVETINDAVNTVKIRRKMDTDSFLTHLAHTAGEKNTGPVLTGARAVLDLLEAAGVLETDGDSVWVAESGDVKVVDESEDLPLEATMPPQPTSRHRIERVADIQVTLEITTEELLDPDKLDGLVRALRKLTALDLSNEVEGE